ncbi:MAG: hypothetical protein NWE83_06640 [Candidatus Bathyarchaeota archaeon]|nr:hypothetical protein [Candidatus Bathyarchaeota archaeon]
MSTTLEQLRIERDYLLDQLKDLKTESKTDATSESICTMLIKEYEAKLIRVESDIFDRELHQDRLQLASKQPTNETAQPTQNPHIIKIETTHTHIRKPVIPRTKPVRVIPTQKSNDN